MPRSSRQALTDDKGRVALIRTITLTWLFYGLRSDEISRTALAAREQRTASPRACRHNLLEGETPNWPASPYPVIAQE